VFFFSFFGGWGSFEIHLTLVFMAFTILKFPTLWLSALFELLSCQDGSRCEQWFLLLQIIIIMMKKIWEIFYFLFSAVCKLCFSHHFCGILKKMVQEKKQLGVLNNWVRGNSLIFGV
jgi:hypothetical protein